ncbi:hypothetical protein ACI784_15350 [Geodermatophilus sp. SYSU D01186]
MDSTATRPESPAVPVRRLLPAMRVLLVVFAVLTALAVGALFVLSGQTDETFAWTIQPPLTAAFLGAGYAAGCVLVVLSLRDGVWARTRVPLLTIQVFVVLTLVATLVHVNRMHFDDDFGGLPLLPKVAAWFWLAVYVVVPVGMVALIWWQERAPGLDPPPRHPVPGVLRAALAVESGVLLVVGAALSVAPATATGLWPWRLTPFTARVVGAWLLAFGVATALAAVAGDLQRLRTAAIAYTVFGVLVAVAVARYSGTVAWSDPAAWVFAVMVAAVVGTGAAGWRLAAVEPGARRG